VIEWLGYKLGRFSEQLPIPSGQLSLELGQQFELLGALARSACELLLQLENLAK
jgi:hypothetical protein